MPQPKIHRYKRNQRLLHAKEWIKTYTGKRIHHGYAKHYAVDKLCAIKELEMLGYRFPPELRESIVRAQEDRKKQRERLKSKKEINPVESDDYFAYIAGYTSGGAPYGVTREEMKALENNYLIDIPEVMDEYGEDKKNENYIKCEFDYEDDLPF